MVWVAVLALLLITACGGTGGAAGNTAPPPEGDPYIAGTVTAVEPQAAVTENCASPNPNAPPDTPVSSDDRPACSTADQPSGRILIEAADGGNQAMLSITAETTVWERFGGGLEPSRFSRIAEGHTVSAWVSGPVAESFPVQATADAVVIHIE